MKNSKLLVALLALALVFSFSTAAFAEAPALIVTGTGLVEGATADDLGENAINEIAYSLDELKALGAEKYLFSATNRFQIPSYVLAEGISIVDLLAASGYTAGGTITIVASDDYAPSINLDEERYYFPTFNADEKSAIPAILAWASLKSEDGIPADDAELEDLEGLTSYVGMVAPDVANQNAFVGDVIKVVVGEELTAKVFNANGKELTRAEVMALGHDEASFTFTNQKGEVTETVKGVYLADLLGDSVADDAVLTFATADNYDMSDYNITYAEAKAKNYMIAYEKEKAQKGWQGIYNVTDDGIGCYFVLYADGLRSAKFLVSVTAEAPVAPPAAEGKSIVLTLGSKIAVVDGVEKEMDVVPEVINGTTFVPVRFITENLGMTVNYVDGKVYLTAEGKEIVLTPGSAEASFNGEAKTLLAAPYIADGRTMVPLRFIGEATGYTVNYDAATKVITIK